MPDATHRCPECGSDDTHTYPRDSRAPGWAICLTCSWRFKLAWAAPIPKQP